MQDDQMDHIIREAAEKHHPAYDDKAWQQMNLLLDKHLPEKSDKKPFPFFWLLLLLLVGGGIFTVWKFGNDKPVTASTSLAENTRKETKPVIADNTAPQTTNTIGADKKQPLISNENNSNPTTATTGNTNAVNTFTLADAGNKLSDPAARIKSSRNAKSRISTKAGSTEEIKEDLKDLLTVENIDQVTVKNNPPKEDQTGSLKEKIKEDKVVTSTKTNDTLSRAGKKDLPNNKIETPPATAKKKTPKKGFGQNFAVLLSGGADLSFIRPSKLGKATLLYGGGISYNIKKFTVKAGFYVADKIYTASNNEYHMDPATAIYYRGDMQYIDANCRVYEIPLQLVYNFGEGKNHNWFAGAGLSSLLMKRETYDYYWKSTTGVIMNKPYTYDNKNKHYFSVLTLSGGYQYALNNRLAVIAEPYIKLPLTGIGAGKIKLSSTGVLITAAIKPFAKKK